MRTTHRAAASTMLAGVATLLLSALPLAAQEGAMDVDLSDANTHAEIGVLESTDFVANTVTTRMKAADGTEVRRTYTAMPITEVDGRGGVMQFPELTSKSFGRVVIVEFVPGEDHPVARRLFFPATRTVRMTQGTIESVDRADQELTLSTPEGEGEIDLGMGYGPTIDSPYGLLQLDDLEAGQDITVYYSDSAMDEAGLEGNGNAAYLIFRHS